MDYITSINRNQVELHCLESLIKKDNAVRFIEAFVNKLDLAQLHFVTKTIKQENSQRYKNNPALYRQRQEWNEHIFGTIKRCMNILGMDDLIAKINNWQPNYKGICSAILKSTCFKQLYVSIFLQQKVAA